MSDLPAGPPDIELTPAEWGALRSGAVAVVTDECLFDLRGPGMVDCLQGLLTNDVAQPGPGSVVFGALLTPKGMIVTDLWSVRDADRFGLVVPRGGREGAAEIFRRTLPPRLARATDVTADHTVIALLGPGASAVLSSAGLPTPPVDTPLLASGGDIAVAGHAAESPVRYHLLVPREAADRTLDRLRQVGAVPGTSAHLVASRIAAGWPALGAEIDDRTLPQEVRFDELSGVSYTKGCYTGQETVARVHFRGHPNRELRGLIWDRYAVLDGRSIQHLGREVGTVRSTLTLAGARLGLAPIRREVPLGTTVLAGGTDAVVTPLPIPPELLPQ